MSICRIEKSGKSLVISLQQKKIAGHQKGRCLISLFWRKLSKRIGPIELIFLSKNPTSSELETVEVGKRAKNL